MAGESTTGESTSGAHGGSSPAGQAHGPHHTGAQRSAWASVLLLVIGFTLVCIALPWQAARLPLLIVGGVCGLLGLVLAKTSGIMESVE